MALSEKTCTACAGGVAPMGWEEAQAKLAEVPGWSLAPDGRAIVRRLTFRNFAQALEFVNRAGAVAEQEKHHPDISFGWGYAELVVLTHKIGGLHENDFILAAKLNKLL